MAEPQLARSLPLDDGEELWKTVHSLATGSANEHALIEHLAYRAFDGTTLTLSIQTTDTGLAAWLTDQTQAVVDLVRRATSHRVEVVLVASETEVAIDVARQRRDAARQLPLVRTVMEIFDADVVDVQDAGSPTDVE
jgi:hypothetical protein